jgi:hypothetical protein
MMPSAWSACPFVLADPPYSVEDADRYQTTMVKRNTVLSALRGLSPGAHVVWLDQVLPMYRKDSFDVEAVIGMVKSTNHRFRVVTSITETATPLLENAADGQSNLGSHSFPRFQFLNHLLLQEEINHARAGSGSDTQRGN